MKRKKKLGDYLGKKKVKAKMGKMKGKIVEPSKRLQFGDVVSAADPKVGAKLTGRKDDDKVRKALASGELPTNKGKKKDTRPVVGKDVGRPTNQGTPKPAPKPKKKEVSPREKKQNQAQGSGGKDRAGNVKTNNDRKPDNRTGKSGSNARRKNESSDAFFFIGPKKPGEPSKRKIDSPSQRRADEFVMTPDNKKHFPVEPKKPRKPDGFDYDPNKKKTLPVKPKPIKKPAPAPKPVPRKGVKPVPGGGSKPAPSIKIDNRNTNINNNSQSQSQSQKQETGSKMKDRRSKVDRIKDRAAKRVDRIEGRKERRAERRKKIGAAKSKVVGAIDNARGKMARRREAVKGAKSEAREQIKKARGKAKKGMMKYKPGGFKPDFLDMDKDGNRNEPMKKALKDRRGKGGYGKKKR